MRSQHAQRYCRQWHTCNQWNTSMRCWCAPWMLHRSCYHSQRDRRRHGHRLTCEQKKILRYIKISNKMTEQREGRDRRRLYLTLIFLLLTHKGQYMLCLKMTFPLPAITWSYCPIFTRATRSIARYMLRQRGWLGGRLADCLSQPVLCLND